MLLNNFFYVLSEEHSDSKCKAHIRLNATHAIYAGHFPGNPITPGVVQIQMLKELMEQHVGRELRMNTMSRCKFLRLLNPNETPELDFLIDISSENGIIKANASAVAGEHVYFKISSTYQ